MQDPKIVQNIKDFEAYCKTEDASAQTGSPTLFESYLSRYADKVGDIINTFIPAGSHPDMDKYLEEITYKFQKKIVKFKEKV